MPHDTPALAASVMTEFPTYIWKLTVLPVTVLMVLLKQSLWKPDRRMDEINKKDN